MFYYQELEDKALKAFREDPLTESDSEDEANQF